MEALEKVKIAVKALDSKRGENIQVIKVTDLTIIADYFVIASGTSSTQVKALADETEYKLTESGVEPNHIEGRTSNWICLDYSDVIVHVFHKEQRDFFQLERLWEDGESVDISPFIAE